LGGGGALLRQLSGALVAPTLLRGVLHVQAQTCAHREGAVCIQDPSEGRRPRSPHGASEFEAGVGASTAVRTERRHHRHHHALHQLAAAHGETFLAAVVRKKLGLRLESEKTDGERVYRIVAREASTDVKSLPSA
jgi:hypothetical protein